MSRFASVLKRQLARLVEPHPSLTEVGARLRAQFAAALALVLVALNALASVAVPSALASWPTWFVYFGLPGIASLVGYGLARSRYVNGGVGVVLGSLSLAAFGTVLVRGNAFGLMGIIPLVLALGSGLLTLRPMLALIGVNVGLTFVLPTLGLLPLDEGSQTGGMLLSLGSLLAAVTAFRERVERDRLAEQRALNAQLRALSESLEHRVQERTREIDALYHLGEAINKATDYPGLLNPVVEALGPRPYSISITLLDDDPQASTATITAIIRAGATQAESLADRLTFDRPSLNYARVLLADMHNPPPEFAWLAAVYRQREIHTALTLRLLVNGRPVGALACMADTAYTFSDDEQRFLAGAADLIASAIERVRLYQEQLQVSEQLRSLDRLKSQFLASMSHELRTPLNAILNFTKFVSGGMYGPVNDQQKEALNKVIASGKHLLALINDVLDIAKIEAGMLTLFVERQVSLVAELETVAALGESLLADKPAVTLRRAYPADLPPILADRRRVRQILLNLVSNACKFTASGQVTLSAETRGNYIRVAVQDTGPGIPPAEQTVVFEAFRQTKTGLSHGGGTGLGLPIARHLAEAHGGRLWLESVPGQGATFFVELPINAPHLESKLIPA